MKNDDKCDNTQIEDVKKPYQLSLDVKNVEAGLGNAGDNKQYKYLFMPSVIVLKSDNDEVNVRLSLNTSKDCIFIGYSKEAVIEQHIITNHTSRDGRSMTVPSPYVSGESYYLTMILYDKKSEKKIYCDPQVHNSPPPRN